MTKTAWMKELARRYNLPWKTVQNHMYRGYCAWPRRTQKNNHKSNPAYACWAAMWTRCTNSRHDKYSRYGGRGITVSAQWLSFDQFLLDVGSRPSKKHSIDRIDPDGNYEPGNVRWLTSTKQALNTSKAKRGDGTYGISKHGRQFQITRHRKRYLFKTLQEAIEFKQIDRS